MLFHHGLFSPNFIPDGRVRAVLSAAASGTTGLVMPGHVIASAVRFGGPDVAAVLSNALRPGNSLEAVRRNLEPDGAVPAAAPSAPLTRASFAPQLLAALDEFDAVLRGSGGVLDGVVLPLLLHLVLARMNEGDRSTVPGLDVARAAGLFRELVARAMDPRLRPDQAPRNTRPYDEATANAEGPPLVLPPQLAPSEDLTRLARTAEAPAAFPFGGDPQYDRLFESIARVLHRRRVNSVLLVGERGVGKATVVAELARRAAAGAIRFLKGRRFLSVDCRYIPPDESRQRLAAILAHLAGHAELVVCLDGFPSLLRAERGGNNKEILLAGVAQARCQFIGLLTPRDYEQFVSDDPDYGEFFARVEVREPDVDVALNILRHFAAGLEHRYGVSIDPEAIRQAVLLSANYILYDQLPAKALKLLHSACEEIDYERSQLGSARDRITADDMVRAVSDVSGVPQETLRGIAERSDYEQGLREVIFGQDRAVREVATELGLIKAGMTDPGKAASVMLFLGQTGTGKTEMAKALARFYSTSKRLKTYTLGNCVEPHSVSTIIGVPPGYVGNEQGGRLINDLNADPYCVFLLDEADKAHPDVLQPFLNLFDEGWVCDQRGVRAYADKAIFILTTNVGQRMIAEMVREGRSIDEITVRMKEALSQIRHSKSDRPVFTPEFLARIKRVIVFNPLDHKAMQSIGRKLLTELQDTWAAKRGKRLEVPEALVKYIGDQAHAINEKSNGKEGGRIVRKLLSEWVEAPLQREVSRRPDEYKACEIVAVDFAALPSEPLGAETSHEVVVTFRRRSDA
jgi:ATP-dependent Clp protease ATP-binding subunit ClpA